MHAGVNIGGFACGNPEDGTDVNVINDQIAVVASAAARSIAEVRATCAVQGSGRISTEGSAMATARAEAYGVAIANIFGQIDACPGCTAVVDAVVRASQRLVVEATASVWFQVPPHTAATLLGFAMHALNLSRMHAPMRPSCCMHSSL